MKAIKNTHLKDYDYSQNGFYFVTINTNYKKPYLDAQNRRILTDIIEELPHKIKGVKLDYYQVMPSHIHLILILECCEIELGEIIRRLKAMSTKQAGFKLWQPNYYECVIRDEKALAKVREYIQNNPLAKKIQFQE